MAAHRLLRPVLLLMWLPPVFVTAPEALAAAYAHTIGVPVQAVGLVLAAAPAGTVVADLVAARALTLRGQRRILAPAALLTCVPLLGFVVSPSVPLALGLLSCSGLGFACGVGLDALLLDRTPEHLRSRVLALTGPVLMTVQGAAFAVWGALGEVLDVRVVIVAAGGAGTLTVAGLLVALRRSGGTVTSSGAQRGAVP